MAVQPQPNAAVLECAAAAFDARARALRDRAERCAPLCTALTELPAHLEQRVSSCLTPAERARAALVCAAWAASQRTSFRVLDLSGSTLAVAGDIRGGGTGREFAANLLSTGTEVWNKWVHPHFHRSHAPRRGRGGPAAGAALSWVELVLPRPVRIAAYALQSANDYPSRDPSRWRLLGRAGAGDREPWLPLHVVDDGQGFDPDRRWAWHAFSVAQPAPLAVCAAVRLEINAVRGGATEPLVQLGHLRLIGSWAEDA